MYGTIEIEMFQGCTGWVFVFLGLCCRLQVILNFAWEPPFKTFEISPPLLLKCWDGKISTLHDSLSPSLSHLFLPEHFIPWRQTALATIILTTHLLSPPPPLCPSLVFRPLTSTGDHGLPSTTQP
jgi:hypothetical protein